MNKKFGPVMVRRNVTGERAVEEAYNARPPTIYRILMATVQGIRQANAPRDTGWTDLLAQAPTTLPTLAQTMLAVPPDADTREMRYDGTSGPTPSNNKRKAQRPGGDEPSTQTGQTNIPASVQLSTVTTLPLSGVTDSNGQGGMVTRGGKRKGTATVQPT